MPAAIKIENLSKAYQLGQIGTGTISRDLERWWARARGKEDPFLKIGEVNDRTTRGQSDVVWSLKDINFEIQQGDAVGIIGRNGAGKSTLLKLLSRVTSPTTGTIKAKGRIASLLEVGTGFHPELTGRENIYLNGAILGMRKKEIDRKLDQIIDFSGVERYIDTPVKRYSSGMYVRLAFAVAAHLDSEILIVDEVLAVGDAEFQKKCLGKMGEVSKGEGRTVLFVSHNMAAVQNLCSKALLMKNGANDFMGSVEDAVSRYLWINSKKDVRSNLETIVNRSGSGKAKFRSYYIENELGEKVDKVFTGDDIKLCFEIKILDVGVKSVDVGFSLHDAYDQMHSYLYSSFQNVYLDVMSEDFITVKCMIENFPFSEGQLQIRGRLLADGLEADWPKDILGVLEIEAGDFFKTGRKTDINAPFLIKGIWEKSR